MAIIMLMICCDVDSVTKIGYFSHPASVFERSAMMEQTQSKKNVVVNRKYFEGVGRIYSSVTSSHDGW
jgi:hypothetical protein